MPDPFTASLFDDSAEPRRSLVRALAHSKPTTKEQKEFHKLVEKIERKREQLQQWQAYGPRYQQRLAEEVAPLELQLHSHQKQMALLIDSLLTQPRGGKRLGRIQRLKLEQMLMSLLTTLLAETQDAELEALHDRYSELSNAEIQQAGMQQAQQMLESVLGFEIGKDHGASTMDELLAHVHEKFSALSEDEAAALRERIEPQPSARSRARSAKAEAAAARREQQAKDASLSLREVYRKLAGSLHPDREQDTVEKQRKTLQMQRANQAYEARDLLTLLELQIEIEQIDATHLSAVPEKRLAHYLQILRDQLNELDAELEHCVLPYRDYIGYGAPGLPAVADRGVDADIAALRMVIQTLKNDLLAFSDPTQLSAALKEYPLEQDEPGGDALFDFLDSLPPMPAPRGRPRGR